jgi:peptide/nickel transport system substrate-binding protein
MALAIPLLSLATVHAALTSHTTIYINGNDNFTLANGVVGGSGAENDPYIIENWDISAENANGIWIENTTAYFIVRGCYMHSGVASKKYGIQLDNVKNGKIDNSIVENNSYGIRLDQSNNNMISNNIVEYNRYGGISLESSNNITMRNNTLLNNEFNFSVYGTTSSDFIHDIDASNLVNGKPIRYLVGNKNEVIGPSLDIGYLALVNCDNIHLENLTLTNHNGQGILLAFTENSCVDNCDLENNAESLLLLNSNNSILMNNNLSNNRAYGIILVSGLSNTMENNRVENNYFGIYLMDSSSNNTIANNCVSSNGDIGICIVNSFNNTILNNNSLNNYIDGICLYISSNNDVENNLVENNCGCGIDISGENDGENVYYSSNNTLANNNVENNYWGIGGVFLHNNTIVNNNVSNNYLGIHLRYSSDNNRICHNSFENNSTQSYDSCSNLWDNGYPSGGNYWSDYIGVDNYWSENQDIPGSDGMGDTPYNISGGANQDRYPLMNPWPFIRDVEVSISPSYQSGLPGEELIYYVDIKNNENVDVDLYSVLTDDFGWDLAFGFKRITIGPGDEVGTFLKVAIPENAEPGTEDAMTVTMVSMDNTVSYPASCIAHVTIVRGVDVSISPSYENGPNGTTLSYNVTVSNTGNASDKYDLTVSDNSGWNPTLGDNLLEVPAGDNGQTTLSVTIPENAAPCAEDNIAVVAISLADNTVSDFDTCVAHAVIARLSPPHSDYGLDTDNDGLYNYLVLDVNVAVTKAGYYQISSALYDNAYDYISGAWAENYLDVGNHQVELRFRGYEIFRSKRDGPYYAHIDLYDGEGNWLDNGEHVTAAYTHDNFQYYAKFAPPHLDYGLDTDNDGLYNYLVVEALVDVKTPGQYQISANLNDNMGNSIPYTYIWIENYLSTGTQTVELRFRGNVIEISGKDGPYRVNMNLYGETDEGWWDWLDSGEHWTQPYSHDEFQTPPAKFAPPHSDYGLDNDNDGLYNYLVVEVKVSVGVAGWYQISGTLYDNDQNWIASASADNYLDVGTQTIDLSFDGWRIERSGRDGLYYVDLNLYDSEGNWLDSGEHVTAAYTHENFQYLAKFSPPHSDYGLDTDNDGLYNYLVVDAVVDVKTPGQYQIYAYLNDNMGNGIPHADVYFENYLSAGIQIVELRFNGYAIKMSGIDGPYRVSMNLSGEIEEWWWEWLDYGEHWTQPYSHDEFQPPPAKFAPPHSDYGLDTDNDNLYNYLVVEANVLVSTAGWYRVDGSLNWIGDYASTEDYLDTGIQTVELRFEGYKIEKSGMNGPYQVYLTLYDNYGNWLDENEHETQPYSYENFQYLAKFSPPHSDFGLDTDNNGLYNYLVVDVNVAVATAGTYRISGDLYDNNGNSIPNTYSSTENYLDVGTQTVELRFDGKWINRSGVDGPYHVYLYLNDNVGNWLDSGEHWTAAYTHENFQYYAKFVPPHSDYGLDTDNDGLYNYLVVEAMVDVDTPGVYHVYGSLYDNTGNFITYAYADNYLSAGIQTVELRLDGKWINRSGINGPYRVSLSLYDNEWNWLDGGEHWTAAYTHDQFQPPPARFAPPHSDYGLDTDNDGFYNYLVVDVNVAVATAGTYRVYGDLYDNNGNYISNTSTSTENYLDVGTQTVELRFDGKWINRSGIDGPYRASLWLYDNEGNWLDGSEHWTAAYTHDQFQPFPAVFAPPHSDYGLDTDDDGLYNYLVVDVNVAVASAGTYRVYGDLYDNNGNYISNTSTSTENYLNVGTQTVELLFDGRWINRSGVDGPYRASFWLYDNQGNYLDYNEHWTAAYTHDQFQPPPAKFAPPHSDYGLDTDNDGLYNYLVVDVNLSVYSPGTYEISGGLYDNAGNYLTSASTENYLDIGTQTVELLFDGMMIQQSGADGPYRVYLDLYSMEDGWIGNDQYWTNAYTHGQFQPSGFITDWLLVGPFSPNGYYVTYTDFLGGEADVAPRAGDAGGSMTWFGHHDSDAFIDFESIFSPNEDVCAYAFAYVYSPSDRQVQLRVGSDDGVMVWLNGVRVLDSQVNRGAAPDQDIVSVVLDGGWNRLLVKVGQWYGGWGFYLRFTDDAGRPITDLTISLEPPHLIWDALITATFSGGSDDAIFGVRPDATSGFDIAYDIPEPPPVIPPYVRTLFYYPEQTPDELHRSCLAPENLMEWPLRIEYADNIENITLTWNVENIPSEYSVLLYRGGAAVADMRAEDNYTFEAASDNNDFLVVVGKLLPFTLELIQGWNMISFPILTENMNPDSIFDGYYVLYRWDAENKCYVLHADSGSFIKPDPDVEVGVGYWVYVLENENVALLGFPVNQLTLSLRQGWNLIGSPYGGSSIADPADDPDNSVIPWAFTWNAVEKSYDMTQLLDTGRGYWIYALRDCKIVTVHRPVKNPGTLVFDDIGDVDSLDPAWSYDTRSSEVIQNVYETLISFNDGSTTQFVPKLAENWTISTDGLTYTFTIRTGVKFQNGDNLTPEDVAYSIKRAMVQDRDGGPVWMFLEPLIGVGTMSTRDENGNIVVPFEQIDNAITVQGDSVVFHLKQPYGPFMQILPQSWASIVDENWCIAQGDWPGTAATYENFNNPQAGTIPLQEKMNGTGPFKLDRWEHTVQIVLVRNDNYWRTPAKLKSVVIKEVDEWTDRKLALLAGDADFVYVPRANVLEVENLEGVRVVKDLLELTADAIFFNFEINENSGWIGSGKLDGNGIPTNFFSDKDVRLGFAYSFDWDKFIQDAFLGAAKQPASPVIDGLPYVDPSAKKYYSDLAQAENHFKQAFGGALWENGFKLTILYNTGNDTRRIAAEIFKQNIESLNPKFSITIESRDWPTYLNEMVASKLTLYYLGWQADFPDPHNFVSAFMSSGGALSAFQHYSNPTVDNLISAGIVEADPAKRQAIYYQLQQIYYDDVPSVMVDQAIGLHVERDWVTGWYYNPLIPGTPWGGDYYPIGKGY